MSGMAPARRFSNATPPRSHDVVALYWVLTDDVKTYTSDAFCETVQRLAIMLKLTRPYRQQTNGKAKRFIQTLQHEWAYVRCYRSNAARLRQLANWLDHYNQRRPHDDIGASVPNSHLEQRSWKRH
jgi:transposase InsO family protein